MSKFDATIAIAAAFFLGCLSSTALLSASLGLYRGVAVVAAGITVGFLIAWAIFSAIERLFRVLNRRMPQLLIVVRKLNKAA